MFSLIPAPYSLLARRLCTLQHSSNPALVLLSGGLDSTVTLALAHKTHSKIISLTFDYGQRGASHEIKAANQVARTFSVDDHRTIKIDPGVFRGNSALTSQGNVDGTQVPKKEGLLDGHDALKGRESGSDIPVTYVPARNLIFLSYAAAVAEGNHIRDIYIGANVVDYSGYPDCRPEFFEAFEKVCKVGTKDGVESGVDGEGGLKVRAPLIGMKKVDIVRKGLELNVNFAKTHSCYDVNENGRPCGLCDSCRLRRTAFLKLGFEEDPAIAAFL